MTRLKLADLADEKPVRISVELPARIHRDLLAYAAAMNGNETNNAPQPEKLIAPMVEHFIANDRSFTRSRNDRKPEAKPVT